MDNAVYMYGSIPLLYIELSECQILSGPYVTHVTNQNFGHMDAKQGLSYGFEKLL